MGDLSLEKVSETYLDVLKEIGNIGAGNAMTALSQMLNCKVDMKVPQVKLLDFNEVGALMGGEEQVMVGVFLGVEGDITGSMMFLVEQGSAKHLLHKIMGRHGTAGRVLRDRIFCHAGDRQHYYGSLPEFPVHDDESDHYSYPTVSDTGYGRSYSQCSSH